MMYELKNIPNTRGKILLRWNRWRTPSGEIVSAPVGKKLPEHSRLETKEATLDLRDLDQNVLARLYNMGCPYIQQATGPKDTITPPAPDEGKKTTSK